MAGSTKHLCWHMLVAACTVAAAVQVAHGFVRSAIAAGLSALLACLLRIAVSRILLRLDLGKRAAVSVELGLSQVSASVHDVTLDPQGRLGELVAACLPFPVKLQKLDARSLRLKLRPFAGLLDLKHAGVDMQVTMAHPDDWDRNAAVAEARSYALALVEARLAALAAAGSPPPRSRLNRLLDAAINCTRICGDNFSLTLEAAPRRSEGSACIAPAAIRASYAVMELAKAVAAPAGEWESKPYMATRWQRHMTVTDFTLAIRPAIEAAAQGEIPVSAAVDSRRERSSYIDVLKPVQRWQLRLSAPQVQEGLRSEHMGELRRIDIEAIIDQAPANYHFSREAARVFWGILGEYWSASAWQLELQTAAENHGRLLSATEREKLVELIRLSARKGASQRMKLELDEAISELKCADLLALRWHVALAGSASSLNGASQVARAPSPAADDATWEAEAAELWQHGTKLYAEQATFHELGIHLDVKKANIDMGRGAAAIICRGLQVSVELLPVATNCRFIADTSFTVRARAGTGSGSHAEQKTLLHCERAAKMELSDSANGSTKSPIVEVSLSVPTEGPMPIKIVLEQLNSWAHVPNWLQTFLPELSGLLESDPVPPAPTINRAATQEAGAGGELEACTSATSTEMAAKKELGYLEGWPLEVDCTISDGCLLLPKLADDIDMTTCGLALRSTQITALLTSGASSVVEGSSAERLQVSVVGAAASVLPDEFILKPMDEIKFSYEACWHEAQGGCLQLFDVQSPFVQLQIMPQAMIVGSQAIGVLSKSVAAGSVGEGAEAAAETTAVGANDGADVTASSAAEALDSNLLRQISFASSLDERLMRQISVASSDVTGRELTMEREISRCLKQIRGSFESMGVDSSGDLGRSEVFQLVESLCVGQHALTRQELKAEFEKFWVVANAGGSGSMCFQELGNALGAYIADGDRVLRRTCGTLAIRAGDLCSTESLAFIGGCEEHFWSHLSDDFRPSQHQSYLIVEESDALTLQWKLLRILKNFSEARYWWNVLLGPRRHGDTSPSHCWAIPEDALFHPACDVLVSALAGSFQKAASIESSECDGEVSMADSPQRHGYKVSVTLAGFKIGLADAMSWLRQQDRLFFAAGMHSQDSEQTALALRVALWRQDDGNILISENDILEAEFSLNDFHGSCTNPFEKKEVGFIERWGVSAKALSEAGNPAVMLQLVSDQHFVFNLSSSLILDVKPLLQSLYLQNLPETSGRRSSLSAKTTWNAAPLDYLLRRVGSLSREHLADHGLLVPFGAGVPEPGEVLWKGTAELVYSGSFTYSVCFQFQLPVLEALSRVMLQGMEVEHLEFKESGLYQVHAKQFSSRSATNANPSIQIYTIARCTEAFCVDKGPEPRFIRDQSGTKISKELRLWNCCGRDAKFWFEDRESARIFGSRLMRLDDGCSSTSEVPQADCVLCLKVDESSMVMRPDFMRPGQWAMLLHEDDIANARPLHRMTTHFNNLLSDTKSSDALPKEALCLCTELAVNKHGRALLQILPPVELRNATQHTLYVELVPPSGDLSTKVTLRAGEALPVPLPALKGPSWTVRSTGAVAHAFMLSKPILEVGKKQSAVRRVLGLALESHALASAEYQSAVGSAISSGRQAHRYTLLMLPELRVVNSLPVRLAVVVHHGGRSLQGGPFPPDARELLPGASADFSLMGLAFRLELNAGTSGSSSILVTSDHMHSNKRFRELSRDLQLGSFECSVQCSWAAGAAPEVIVYGKYVVFNKTGLPLMVRSVGEEELGPEQTINNLAILTASDHEIQAAIKEVVAEQPPLEMPHHSGFLQLWDTVFDWVPCQATVSQGKLLLERDNEACVHWELSEFSIARATEACLASGEFHGLSLEDPRRAHNIVLKASSEEDLSTWLKVFKDTIEAWRVVASTNKLSHVWNSAEGGRCQRCAVPHAACGAWSKSIPVQAPVDGEATIEVALDSDPLRPSSYRWLFLGVQVQPLVGALGCSSGITFTPRFVVQNRTSAFLQVLPAILSPRMRDWTKPVHAVLARTLLENHKSHWKRSHPANLLDQTTSLEEGAVWVPPGENAAMFHFPLRCDPQEAAFGNKAVSLRLEGKPPLQVVEVESGNVLELERVGSNFMPYTDQFWHFGPLPQVLRGAAQSRRLRCMVGPSSPARSQALVRPLSESGLDFESAMVAAVGAAFSVASSNQGLGELALTASAEVFVAVNTETEAAAWLQSAPWEALQEQLELRHRGQCVATLRLFRRHVVAGSRICVDGAGPGSLLLFEAAQAAEGATSAADLSDDSRGLPWSAWVTLETTGEEFHELQAEDVGDTGNKARFVRCSVQVKASTAFLVLSDEPAPYRVENWSLSRTLTIGFSSRSSGLRERQILPPLSWVAFSWPVIDMKRQNVRELIVHDVVTQKSKCIEIDDIGPGTPVMLNEDEEQRLTGLTAPLTEFGFRSVVLQNDPHEMADYMTRVCKDMGGQVRARDVAVLARQCLGKPATQSLQALRNFFIIHDFAPRPQFNTEDLTEQGCRRAEICEVFMEEFLKTLLASSGLAAQSLGEVRACAAWCCNYHAPVQRVMDEVLARIGLRTSSDRDAAYDFAARSCNQVLLAFYLKYALHERGRTARYGLISSAAAVLIETHQADGSLQPLRDVLAGVQWKASKEGVANAVPSGLPDPLSFARSECISEDGCKNVLGMQHAVALELFIRRIIVEQGGALLSAGSLQVFCESLLQEAEAWSLARLRQELALQEWVRLDQRGGARLSIDRWYDDATKVLSLTDSEEVCQDWKHRYSMDAKPGAKSQQSGFSLGDLAVCDIDVQLAGFHFCMLYDSKVQALGTGADADVADDAKMDEVLVITADHFRLRKQSESLKVDVCLHHFQIDSLRNEDQLNPIVLAPMDSGFHGDRRELPPKGEYRKVTSFFVLAVEIVPSSILHFRELTLIMQPLVMRLDAAYWTQLGFLLLEWFPSMSDTSVNESNITGHYIEELCTGYLEMPGTCTSLQLVYFEHLFIGSVVADVEILVVAQQMRRKAHAGGDVLEDVGENAAFNWSFRINFVWLSNFLHGPVLRGWKGLRRILGFIEAGFSGLMQSIGGGVLSGVGHITPKFSFPDLLLTHEFGDLNPLISRLVRSYGKSGVSQFWKVLGSTNILGDPIGLGTSVTGGVVQFFRKTGTEIAQGDLRGEGVKALAQGVVGGTFGHAGKFLGALGDTVDALVDTGALIKTDARAPGSVDHLGDGIVVGVSAFAQSAASGVKGVVMLPIQGFQERGVTGLAGGAVRGVAGAVAKPISGLLHGAQHIAAGVDATTRLWDHARRLQPRRLVRTLLPGGSLQPLVGIEFSPRICLCIDSLSLSSTALQGATYQVELRLTNSDWRKSTQFGRLARSGVIFEPPSVHWLPTHTFLGNDLILEVKDKALSGQVSDVLFQAHLPGNCPEIITRLSELLRRPAGDVSLNTNGMAIEHVWQPLSCRWRPVEAVRVHLSRTGSAPELVDATLLLRFWPAWDPLTVPHYQRYREVPVPDETKMPDFTPRARVPPPPCQGWLEKRTKGVLNHWSLKWVVVKEYEFLYWEDKAHCDRGDQPKVRFSLAQTTCPFRFAPGNEPESCFVQVMSGEGDGDPVVEARWRPAAPSRWRRRASQTFRARLDALKSERPFGRSPESSEARSFESSASMQEPYLEEGANVAVNTASGTSEWLQWTRSHAGREQSDTLGPDTVPLSAAEWLQAILQHSIKD